MKAIKKSESLCGSDFLFVDEGLPDAALVGDVDVKAASVSEKFFVFSSDSVLVSIFFCIFAHKLRMTNNQ